jgi:hypothetical protein
MTQDTLHDEMSEPIEDNAEFIDDIPEEASEELDIIEDNIVENGEDVAIEEIIPEEIVKRKLQNVAQIRILKKFRKINKFMMGGRDFTTDDIVLDENGNEIESIATREENLWPTLELVVNVTGSLEVILISACLEEITRNEPEWVYLGNDAIAILKRVKEWMIKNNKYVMQAFETGCLIDAIIFCKIQDEKWGRWKYLSFNSESTLPEYHEKMNSQVIATQEDIIIDKVQTPI